MATKDRLGELTSMNIVSGKKHGYRKMSGDKDLDKLLPKVNKIDNSLKELAAIVDQLDALQNEQRSDPERRKGRELAEAQRRVHKIATLVSKMIQELTGTGSHAPDDAVARMKDNHVKSLTRRYVEEMNRFHRCQAEHLDKMRGLLVRQMEISGKDDVSQQRLDSIMQQDQQQIFVDNLPIDAENATLTLDAIRAREKQVLDLENDIKTINEIFVQLHDLVHEQGDTIDSIERNMDATADHTERGTEKLRKIRKSRYRSRKCKIIFATIGLIALGILVVIIVFAV